MVDRNIRPKRPNKQDAPYLCDTFWRLLESCWDKDVMKRPVAESVYQTITEVIQRDGTCTVMGVAQTPGPSKRVDGSVLPPIATTVSPTHHVSSPPRSLHLRLTSAPNSSFLFSPLSFVMVEGDSPLLIKRWAENITYDENDVVFKSRVVSRIHAKLWFVPGGKLFIEDTKSSSGTFLNGVRLSPANIKSEPHWVKHGDIVRFGEDVLTFIQNMELRPVEIRFEIRVD